MLSNRLKELRNLKGLTQRELAKELNISNGAIAMYETAKRSPDNETLNLFANYFEVSTDYLLGRTDDPTPYRDINADIDAKRDFDAELKELLKDEELVAFHDFAGMDDESKKEIIQFIKFKKEQVDKKKGL